MRAHLIATLLATVSIQAALMRSGVAAQTNGTLTAVAGLKVGHHTLKERPTGCTVILAEAGATAGVDVRGAAPATRETDLLNPVNTVQVVHAVVLSGGSAFGLDSASGVMRYLEEKKIGFEFGPAHVPIVSAAALFVTERSGRTRTAGTAPLRPPRTLRFPRGASAPEPAPPSARPEAWAGQ